MEQAITSNIPIKHVMDESWKGWVKENLARQCSAQEIFGILMKNNFALPVIREAMGDDFPSQSLPDKQESLAAAEPSKSEGHGFLQMAQKRESLVVIKRKLRDLSPTRHIIERRYGVSREEFLEKYYSASRPVILCGMMENWAACERWTPEYLKHTCGDETVEIMASRDSNPLYEIEDKQHRREVKFAEFVDMVVSRSEGNDYYLTARNNFFARPGTRKLLDDIEIFTPYLKPDMSGNGIYMWFGPKGTVTPLHHDTMNILIAQVQGRKHIRLISADDTDLVYNHYGVYSLIDAENPDYQKFPKLRDATVFDVELAPGEVLFVPVGWWHHVRGLDQSITLTFTNFIFQNDYSWFHPKLAAPDQATNSAQAANDSAKDATRIKVHDLGPAKYQELYTRPQTHLLTHPRAKLIETSKLQLITVEKFLTEQECDQLVRLIEKNLRPSTVTVYKEGFRTSRTSDLGLMNDPLVHSADEKIARAIGIRLPYSEGLQAQKYEVGQLFKNHTDYFQPGTEEYEEHSSRTGNRTWTFMIYLNDTPKGGGTGFPNIDQVFYPKKGNALVWNNLTTAGKPNPHTLHSGMPVEAGEKIIITKWFRELGDGTMFFGEY